MSYIEQLVSAIVKLKREMLRTSFPKGASVDDNLGEEFKLAVERQFGSMANSPAVYWFETTDVMLGYPICESKVYGIGKAEHLRSRLASKIRADLRDEKKNFRSFAPQVVFNYTYFNYIKAYGARVWVVDLSSVIGMVPNVREVEALFLIAFLYSAGNYPFANKQGSNQDVGMKVQSSKADSPALAKLFAYVNQWD